jgi:hypothetical protein
MIVVTAITFFWSNMANPAIVQPMPNEVVGTNPSLFEHTPQETKRLNIGLSGVNITGNIQHGEVGRSEGWRKSV